jgi:hypothetical protein
MPKKRPEKRPGRPARDTPVLGPRGKRVKVKPLPATAPQTTYDPGMRKVGDGDPWIEEGIPEPNG